MPVGTDLVLHEAGDREAILLDGKRLGGIVQKAAERYKTPLAFPLMDLTVEKAAIVAALGYDVPEPASFHFMEPMAPNNLTVLLVRLAEIETPRMRANAESLKTVGAESDLVPVGMSIGPFSLMSKLIADPITPLYLAGAGATAEEEPEVLLVEQCLTIAMCIIRNSLDRQIAAGAKAIFVCEPAANIAYISPKQLDLDTNIFERYVMDQNRVLAQHLHDRGVDLIFHDCGELTDSMVKAFGTLDPAILSLGSSRKVWEDAPLIPDNTVIYGNMPTKKFYSDTEMPLRDVVTLAQEIRAKMAKTGHPFILGSECDVLCVNGAEKMIGDKVNAFLTCA